MVFNPRAPLNALARQALFWWPGLLLSASDVYQQPGATASPEST
jgi:hypothetical protein